MTLRKAGVPIQESIEIAVSCMTALVEYGYAKRRNAEHQPDPAAHQSQGADEIIGKCHAEGRPSLFEYEAYELLRA